jgi:hypothetical protein
VSLTPLRILTISPIPEHLIKIFHNIPDARVLFDTLLSVLMCPAVFTRVHTSHLKLDGNDNLTCVPQDFIDSLSSFDGPDFWMMMMHFYDGPEPCAVSFATSFCMDLKNVAAVS